MYVRKTSAQKATADFVDRLAGKERFQSICCFYAFRALSCDVVEGV
jgi:hypothetical protein